MNTNSFQDMFKAIQAWNSFNENHPRFHAFRKALEKEGIREGSIVDIKVTTPEGKELETNMLITQSDLDLLKMVKGMM